MILNYEMKSKNIQINSSKNKSLEPFNKVDFCEVSKASVEIMLERFCKGKKIDFLDIDVEGADIDVLESLDFHKYSPELICVEVIEKNNEDSQIFKFLKKRGYQKIWSGVFSHVFKRT